VLPCQRRDVAAGCGVDAHLGDLFAAQAEDKVVGGREAVGGWVAAPCGNGPLGHARAIGVVSQSIDFVVAEVPGAHHRVTHSSIETDRSLWPPSFYSGLMVAPGVIVTPSQSY